MVMNMKIVEYFSSKCPEHWLSEIGRCDWRAGQFKAFIDRCTPWCNTHEPHAALSLGKKGYAITLRTGPGMKECERIIGSIEHFFGHLEIQCSGHLGLCSVEYREAVEARQEEIEAFCRMIMEEGERTDEA